MDLTFDFNKSTYNVKKWNGEKLGRIVTIDTETTMVPSHMVPDMVTLQAYGGDNNVYYVPKNLTHAFMFKHYDSTLVAHNAPFDFTVLEKIVGSSHIYEKYDNNLIADTGVLYRLLHLAQLGFVAPKYNLNLLSKKFLNIELIGKGEEQCEFGKYLNQPLDSIPTEMLTYGAKDVVATHQIYHTLCSLIQGLSVHGSVKRAWGKWGMLSAHIQVKGEWSLNKIYKTGIGFDLGRKDAWLDEANKELEVLQDRLATYGWVRGQKGVKDKYEAIMTMLGIADKLPRSEKSGGISSKGEHLEPYRDISFVADYLDFIELEKTTTFVRDVHTGRLHPRYSSIMNTGRTSCSKPNIQQIPRKGGIREMFIPKPGHKLVDIDYSSLELAGLAQLNKTLFGYSTMGDLINEGECLHYNTAMSVYGKSKEDVTKEERGFAKIPNFGFGANMAPSTFVDYCKGYGVSIDERHAEDVKEKWLNTYPEMREYYKIGNQDTHATLTGRVRANCSYTAFLNTGFQGLCADGFKLAMYEVTRAGFTIVAQIHDQLVLEVREDKVEEDMPTIQSIMVENMRKVIPDIKIDTEGMVLDRWCK